MKLKIGTANAFHRADIVYTKTESLMEAIEAFLEECQKEGYVKIEDLDDEGCEYVLDKVYTIGQREYRIVLDYSKDFYIQSRSAEGEGMWYGYATYSSLIKASDRLEKINKELAI